MTCSIHEREACWISGLIKRIKWVIRLEDFHRIAVRAAEVYTLDECITFTQRWTLIWVLLVNVKWWRWFNLLRSDLNNWLKEYRTVTYDRSELYMRELGAASGPSWWGWEGWNIRWIKVDKVFVHLNWSSCWSPPRCVCSQCKKLFNSSTMFFVKGRLRHLCWAVATGDNNKMMEQWISPYFLLDSVHTLTLQIWQTSLCWHWTSAQDDVLTEHTDHINGPRWHTSCMHACTDTQPKISRWSSVTFATISCWSYQTKATAAKPLSAPSSEGSKGCALMQ